MGVVRWLLQVVLLPFALSSAAYVYYACPPTSLCVPPTNCPKGNETFNVLDKQLYKQYDRKYVCGVFPECEGLICCNDPIGLPDNFVPNKTHWCYSNETVNATFGSAGKFISVHPYPGLEAAIQFDYEADTVSICPQTSVCVRASACPQRHITFYPDISDGEYTCGSYNGTVGFVCCLIIAVGKHVPEQKEHVRSIFLKEIKENPDSTSLNFASAGLLDGVANINVKTEKIYEDITGRSSNEKDYWECGRTLHISQELQRIYAPIGDRTAKEGDYPWHVAILSSYYEYLCSGVIIGEKLVLSIAHCFGKHNSSKELLVRVGDMDLKQETESNPAYDVKVNRLVLHPKYENIKLEWDIAVLELQESVRGLGHVRPVCLPLGKYSPAINQCKVPGWGQFSQSKEERDEFSYELREASFYVIDKGQCQNALRKTKELGPFFKLQDSVLCAKGFSSSDTCQGDGGSGLVCRDKDVFVLKGLVSYGLGCGYNLPGVYTDVESSLEFIANYRRFEKPHSDANKNLKDQHRHTKVINERESEYILDNSDAPHKVYKKLDEVHEVSYEHDTPHEVPYQKTEVTYTPLEPIYGQPEETYPPHRSSYEESDYDLAHPPIYEEPEYDFPHRPDYKEPHYDSSLKPIYKKPEETYSPRRPGYEEPDYDDDDFPRRPGYEEPDYDDDDFPRRPGYEEPAYDDDDFPRRPGYEPNYDGYFPRRQDYGDFPCRPCYGEPDYTSSPFKPIYKKPKTYPTHHPDFEEHDYDYVLHRPSLTDSYDYFSEHDYIYQNAGHDYNVERNFEADRLYYNYGSENKPGRGYSSWISSKAGGNERKVPDAFYKNLNALLQVAEEKASSLRPSSPDSHENDHRSPISFLSHKD